MQRRDFMLKTAALAATGLTVSACTTTATTTTTPGKDVGKQHRDIDADVSETLARLQSTVKESRELINKASGVLVFPSVIAAGLGVGGQYGEGALRVKNMKPEYYTLASLSIGLQIGAQSKAIIFLFMEQSALDKFRSSEGWQAGADASVAILKVGVNGNLDVTASSGPILAFVLTNAGLMANLTLEGTKISRQKM